MTLPTMSTSAFATMLPEASISATIAEESPAWASANAPTRENESVLIRICRVRSMTSAMAANPAETATRRDRATDAERRRADRRDEERATV